MSMEQNIPLRAESRFKRLKSIAASIEKVSLSQWAGLVFTVALLQRLALYFLYQPIPYGDTPAYWRMAAAMTGDWATYDGTRTPGYPMLLAIFGSEERLWLGQMAMGLAITFLFFNLAWQISGAAWFAGCMALLHTLNPAQILFEPNILSETATTFWLALTAAGVFIWLYHSRQRSYLLAVGLSLAVSMVWLTRPLFIYLPFWIFLFLLFSFTQASISKSGLSLGQALGKHAPGLAAFLLAGVVVIFGWISFIHIRFGDWSLTMMTGYHMVQHTGSFFEYVPDRYAGLRDTYLRYRDVQMARHGNQTNTIWAAIPEMQQISGENFYSLSRLLARISTQLIREHPDLYLRNVLKGWWYFWRAPVYWSPQSFEWQALANLLSPLILAGRLGVFAVNLVFLASSAALAWGRARQVWRIPPALWWMAGTVWAASIVQTLADHGDNPRFLVPLQSFVVLWVFWIAWQTAKYIQIQKDAAREQ
jgi:hypothetical protein